MKHKLKIIIMDHQKQVLEKVSALIDSDFARLGKVALMAGINARKLIDLRDGRKALSESDFQKLKNVLEDFKK
jgi:hypothetical protein